MRGLDCSSVIWVSNGPAPSGPVAALKAIFGPVVQQVGGSVVNAVFGMTLKGVLDSLMMAVGDPSVRIILDLEMTSVGW